MSAAAVTKPVTRVPPRPWARITGAVYLLYFSTAVLGQFLAGRGLVYGDAVGVVADLCYAALTLLLYRLFAPVSRSLSLGAALLSLAGCALMILAVFHAVPYHLSPLLFFGPYCIALGYLLARSTFLPRILGLLMALAGAGWLLRR